jgi:signal transduction histidine kinase
VIPYIVIENAVKYSPHGFDIDVEFDENDSEVSVIVRNLGPKIEEEEGKKIFQPGVRARNAVAAGTAGFGIGLFFLRDLVERKHSGRVGIFQYNDDRIVGGVPYCTTEIQLRFPRAV